MTIKQWKILITKIHLTKPVTLTANSSFTSTMVVLKTVKQSEKLNSFQLLL